jgi:cystathionine beta-lyase/cystathionine gamma-synthase
LVGVFESSKVKPFYYPGLPSHPFHEKTNGGFGGMVSLHLYQVKNY